MNPLGENRDHPAAFAGTHLRDSQLRGLSARSAQPRGHSCSSSPRGLVARVGAHEHKAAWSLCEGPLSLQLRKGGEERKPSSGGQSDNVAWDAGPSRIAGGSSGTQKEGRAGRLPSSGGHSGQMSPGKGRAWMGGEQGWVQMEAMERMQDAASEDLGSDSALCPAPGWASGPWRRRVRSGLEDLRGGTGSVWKVLSGARQGVHGDGGISELILEGGVGHG